MGCVSCLYLVLSGITFYVQAQTFEIRTEFMNGDLKFSWTNVSTRRNIIDIITNDGRRSDWILIYDDKYTVKDVWKYKSVTITVMEDRVSGNFSYYNSEYKVLRIDSQEGEKRNLKWTQTIFPRSGEYKIYHFNGDKSKAVIQIPGDGTTSIDPEKYVYHTRPYNSTNIILEVRNITLMDAGYYGGGTSETDARSGQGVILVVRGKPTKPEIEGLFTVNETSDVTLTCSSKSTSRPLYYRKDVSLSYIWYLNDTVIDSETSMTLRVLKISREARFNQYSCQSKESIMSEKSVGIKINVLYGPSSVIIRPPLPVNQLLSVKEGDYIGPYHCSADCNPPCSIQWKYRLSNGAIGNADSIGGTLLKQRVFRDKDWIRCKATTHSGSKSTTIKLYIMYLSEPVLSVNGKRTDFVDVKEGDSLSLSCEVEAKPTPSLSISKISNRKILESQIFNAVDVSIAEVKCSDSDIYRCTGKMEGFSSKHKDVTIGVLCDPRIDEKYWFKAHYGTKSGTGVTVTVNAAIIAYPKPSANLMSWTGPATSNIENKIKERERGSVSYKHWIVSTIPVEDDRYYGNYIMTYDTKVIFNITINDEDKPKPPLNFIGYSYSSGYVNLTWISDFNGGPEQFFILSRKDKSGWIEVANITDHGEGAMGYYDPGLLNPGHDYWYRLESCNRIDCSAIAVVVKIAVLECKTGYFLNVKKPDVHYRNNSDCWPCGNCRYNLPCNTTSGHCSEGCQTNYKPPYCTDLITTDQSSTISATTIILISVSALLVVAVLTVTWIAIQQRLRRKREYHQPQPNVHLNTTGTGNQMPPGGAADCVVHEYVEVIATGDNHTYDEVNRSNEAPYSEIHTYLNTEGMLFLK